MNINIRLERLRAMTSKILTVTGIVSFLIFSACDDDPTFLGRDLLPPTDDIFANFTDSSAIKTYPERSQAVVTSSNPEVLLGSYYDSIFGYSKADFISRMEVSTVDFESDFEIDSLILSLKFSGYFGDSTSSHTIRIYELTDTLSLDSLYFSNTLPDGKYNPMELASKEVMAKDTLVTLKIDDPDLIERFEEVDDSVFNDQSDFYNFFFGFYITTEDAGDQNALQYLNLASSDTKFSMYYHLVDSTDTDEMTMFIAESTPKANTFYHDYTGSRVDRFLENPGNEDSLIYVSAMAGVNTKLTFPEIEEWLDKRPVAINKAQLILPVEDSLKTGLSEEQFPSRLSLYSYDADDNYDLLYDYQVDNSNNKDYFNGAYDPAEDAYVFNIAVHLQSYIQGDIENMNLILVARENSYTANRVVIKGPGSMENKIKLVITYTEF